jgi:hypothetical protein
MAVMVKILDCGYGWARRLAGTAVEGKKAMNIGAVTPIR